MGRGAGVAPQIKERGTSPEKNKTDVGGIREKGFGGKNAAEQTSEAH